MLYINNEVGSKHLEIFLLLQLLAQALLGLLLCQGTYERAT